jgi:DNA-binding PadR family transcriptional regulator
MTPRSSKSRILTSVDLQILLTLATGPLHGYGIKLDVAHRTDGTMALGSGTLYEAIQRLEQRAYIALSPPPEGEEADPRRRYYRLEPAGERAMRAELERMESVVSYGRSLDLLSDPEEA